MRIQWVLFQVIDGKVELLSRPFDSKAQAEKERSKYPLRERNKIGVGNVPKV
jgi:hypothetical protein